jgi:hypothetical protein
MHSQHLTRRQRRRRLRACLMFCFGLSLFEPAVAGCVSDCREEYDSEVQNCQLLHDDPDDADDLKLCIGNAKDEYDDCAEECRS